ncbi:MAG: multifunctional CCA tRNA nucleotidyl transferase/2'3'-cyclic phosphodiesterase/2'nucleotidase/phosphatase [Coxiellaceae bacterium]|nr:multifunctional CCA tRNA nucleotidyl transferase/2'3'-cyclic phosphodiesterase/2'nucleotidase/phosphatase [Coxiellaceae bacterium]
MKVYLVGGAVRDELLGLPIKERDWVVVGSTSEEMLRKGFKRVGRDFPVFLHPETHEEYALARTERKINKGYTGFICYSDPLVSLEDDLRRRDLTINAMAKDFSGNIIDPFGGRKDLIRGIFRHVSSAFTEDPVRILRLARFAARFGNFKVHPETNKLMKEMLHGGEIDALVPERVWQELEQAFRESYPERFFMVLKKCQVLSKLFPEIASQLPAIKKGLHQIASLNQDSLTCFAVLAFNLSETTCFDFCKKYRLPNNYYEISRLVLRLKNELLPLAENSIGLINLLDSSDAYRKPQRLKNALSACLINNVKLATVIDNVLLAYEITKEIRLTSEDINQKNTKNLRLILHEKRNKILTRKLHPAPQ